MDTKMIFRTIIYWCLLFATTAKRDIRRCLTGYMTDIQSWVDEDGSLTIDGLESRNAIDLSANSEPVLMLQQKMMMFRSNNHRIKYLSMANCELSRVPPVFNLKDTNDRLLAETVMFVTLFGNNFSSGSPAEQYDMTLNATRASEVPLNMGRRRHAIATWSTGFQEVLFPKLLELDLRMCSIETLNENLFRGMPQLESLYLGENKIHQINNNAFAGLVNLVHLDMSRNDLNENDNSKVLKWDETNPFANMRNLQSLDFSFTKLSASNLEIFRGLGNNFQRLSLCKTGLLSLGDSFFNGTSLRYLDLSNNNGILTGHNVLAGTEDTLQILYADDVSLKTIEIFHNFKQLEVLKLSRNEVSLMTNRIAKTLTSLKVLDIDDNRITSWFTELYSNMPQLRYLSLRNNNINLITEEMVQDFENLSYIALSGNFIVCNCHTRELYDLAVKNENKSHDVLFVQPRANISDRQRALHFHTAYHDFNILIENRKKVVGACHNDTCDNEAETEMEMAGNFVLVDYDADTYQCMLVPESKSIPISKVDTCQTSRGYDIDDVIIDSRNKLLFLITIPTVMMPLLIFGYMFRRNFRYFFITMRNSAMLSLINRETTVDDDTIYNYDVFVSYCNDDRGWILDYLLPHVEKDCNVSACLHERDFQVGLSILENIVSCMDRSRSIMLIISQKFLLSQWCQFEMHLAQHRLLETRREDLILVLLEDIPRRLRPNTLHYLMLTKTYIVWPKEPSEQAVFWKRLKKSLVTDKLKRTENASLA